MAWSGVFVFPGCRLESVRTCACGEVPSSCEHGQLIYRLRSSRATHDKYVAPVHARVRPLRPFESPTLKRPRLDGSWSAPLHLGCSTPPLLACSKKSILSAAKQQACPPDSPSPTRTLGQAQANQTPEAYINPAADGPDNRGLAVWKPSGRAPRAVPQLVSRRACRSPPRDNENTNRRRRA